ncbi:unnamed protein product [Ambrosiozyma monospora]|uniref:Unnamed protein product n=1 Tax=Ambrosiozyma monospora TaxID=43982 RepID=A0ACB5TCQ9_AMBMO|nr:unnamed protein product [Ambrosiozyma monospora]
MDEEGNVIKQHWTPSDDDTEINNSNKDNAIYSPTTHIFSTDFKLKVSSKLSGRAIFGQIPTRYWTIPNFIDDDKMTLSMDRLSSEHVSFADSLNHRLSFRFHSGFIHKMKVFNLYDYYWRVEAGTVLDCDLVVDVFDQMVQGDYKYGFNMAVLEDKKAVRGLWKNTLGFFEKLHPEFKDDNAALGFVQYDRHSHSVIDGHFNLCHYWTESEIVNLSFLKSREYGEFFDLLESSGNFFYERWSDGVVRTMAVSFLVGDDQILYLSDVRGFNQENEYDYKQGTQSCPVDAEVRTKFHCNCNVKTDMTFKKWSCIPTFFRGLDLPFPAEHDDHDWTEW